MSSAVPYARKSRITLWFDKLSAFKVEDLFSKSSKRGPRRTVFVNENLPDSYFDRRGRVKKEHLYTTNQVITSKYTILTFVPRNLLEQFRRIANVFFLGIAILQFFSKFSTVSPGLVIFPLLLVLAITGLKDGYEDVKRHQSDRHVNHSQVRVLASGDWVNPNPMGSKSKTFVRGILPSRRKIKKIKLVGSGEELKGVTSPVGAAQEVEEDIGIEFDDVPQENGQHHFISHRFSLSQEKESTRPHWKKTIWEDVRVGDFVKIMDDEPIPADVLICSTSEDENVAYVETKNLDGETNLKSRNAVAALTHIRSAADCASPHNSFRVDCDRPDTNMFKLNAAVRVGKDVFPIDMQMVLLRGMVLRNTGWVIGLVLYTGEDTRIVMNAGGTPSKRGKVERQMNPQVFLNLLILAVMATVCGILDSILEHRAQPNGALWLYGADSPGDNPSINGLVTFAFALITFQNIVPISLYISIEFVRTVQAAFIYWDKDMYYEKTDQPCLARSWNLSDDLGQVEYIFSDKTGTLTQNSMVFQKCSIGGKMYNGAPKEEELDSDTKELPPEFLEFQQSIDRKKSNSPPADAKEEDTNSMPNESRKSLTHPEDNPGTELTSSGSSTAVQRTSSHPDPHASHPTGPKGPGVMSSLDANAVKVPKHFYDPVLAEDLKHAVNVAPDSADAAQARNLNGFFTVLSLCHTVLTSVDPDTGAIEYKAQSPDEAALVQAAADMGFVFRGRDREVLLLQTPFSVDERSGEEVLERYELLNVLEFTSARKRMSVIVRKLDVDDERIFLLCKGADNVIFERLKQTSGPSAEEVETLKKTTEKHLDEFAGQGLRTLTLAYKVIGAEEYEMWSERYHEATVAMDDREEKIEAVSNEIEQDLRLLGATAIEDRLQDGVPETIADLKKAGIKVWVATGDKLETAIAIGHSTNLISSDSNIIVIRGGREGNSRPVWDQLVRAVHDFFPESNIVDEHGALIDASGPMSPRSPSSPRHPSQTQSPSSVWSPSPPMPGQQESIGLRRFDTGISSIVGSGNGERPGGFILVIDGSALGAALVDDQHKRLLLCLAMLCEGVICCRASPLQKALVVRLVKDGLGAMTLAIGDGANDVSMIQAADVGVGISGEEGLQAVNSSDYAIAQFRFLKRLLFVHGHWSYARNGNMILNFFYKNIVCIGVLWWFQIYCGWSSNYVFEYTYLLFWNSFWTIAPVIGIGLFDRIVDSSVLMQLPELYKYGREGTWFGMKLFIIYMLDGIIQSAIIFFLVLYTYFTTSARPDGYQINQYEFSTTMVFGAVFAANLFTGLNTHAWTGWVFFAMFIGIVLLWVYTAIYNTISPGWFVTPVWGNNGFLFESAYYWLAFPLVFFLALTPRYVSKAYGSCFRPNDLDIIRYVHKKNPNYDFSQETSLHAPMSGFARPDIRTESVASLPHIRPSIEIRSSSRTDMSTGTRSVYRGFDFSTEENGVAMRRLQSNLSERRSSSRNLAVLTNSPRKKKNVFSVGRSFLRKKVSMNRRDNRPSSKDSTLSNDFSDKKTG